MYIYKNSNSPAIPKNKESRNFFMSIHDFIKKLRESLSLSQQQVADHLGCTRQTYTQIENGSRDISLGESRKLAELFQIPFEDFVMEQKPVKMNVQLEDTSKKKPKKTEIRISVPQNKVETFKEVLLYILEKVGAKPNIGMTVLYKLLYFIDFDYYEKYEEQLIGARYQKNHFGPTPVEFAKITETMIARGDLEKVKSTYFKHEQTKFLPKREPKLELLTARDIKHIDEVLDRLSGKNAAELSDYSHQDVPWISTDDGEIIDYELVFYRSHETTVRNYD